MQTLMERFAAKYVPEPNSGCWLWIGYTAHGYAAIGNQYKKLQASHVSLKLVGIDVPVGMFACHRCDNPLCVNPDHLFIGTSMDNTVDAMRKGRHSRLLKECRNGHQLTPDNVHVGYRIGKSGNAHVRRSCRACWRARTAAYKARKGSQP